MVPLRIPSERLKVYRDDGGTPHNVCLKALLEMMGIYSKTFKKNCRGAGDRLYLYGYVSPICCKQGYVGQTIGQKVI